MIIGEVVGNLSEVFKVLPPQFIDSIEWIIFVLKAVGIVFVFYVLYLIVMGFLAFRRIKRMKHIEKMVVSMDKKLDRLLKEKKKKRNLG